MCPSYDFYYYSLIIMIMMMMMITIIIKNRTVTRIMHLGVKNVLWLKRLKI